ncbi:unnamed protein product [Musa textilis]
MEGSDSRKLVDESGRQQHAGRLLAGGAVHASVGPGHHGGVGRGGGEHEATRGAQLDADGIGAVRGGRVREGELLPQPGGRRLRQQPDVGSGHRHHGRELQMLRHQELLQRRLGHLFLLWRTGQQPALPLTSAFIFFLFRFQPQMKAVLYLPACCTI